MDDFNKIQLNFKNSINIYKKLFAKIMNIEAIKYDCLIKYDDDSQTIIYKGDKESNDYIIKETAEKLNINLEVFKKIVL